MKVGDLVVLSAYGKSLKNYYQGRHDDVGIVCDVRWYGKSISVLWSSDGKKEIGMDRRDIKFLSKVKKNEKNS